MSILAAEPGTDRLSKACSLEELILQGKARSDDTNELGANFMAPPPDHFVCFFPDDTIARQQQRELIRNFQSPDIEPHAIAGNVDNVTVARANTAASSIFAKR